MRSVQTVNWADGRYDVLALPRARQDAAQQPDKRPAILLEMKSISGLYQEDPERAIATATKGIHSRAYARELEALGYSNILKVVVVSDGKQVWVREAGKGAAACGKGSKESEADKEAIGCGAYLRHFLVAPSTVTSVFAIHWSALTRLQRCKRNETASLPL